MHMRDTRSAPENCVLLQNGQGRSLGRLTRRGVRRLPQIGKWWKNCSGKNKGPFWRQVHFKTVIPNVAYSIPRAPCRAVVPSGHWTFGVMLGVHITRCHHSDQLLETIQSVFPNLYALSFILAWRKKKRSGKEKQKVQRKGDFLSEVPLVEITLVSLGLRSAGVSASVHTEAV